MASESIEPIECWTTKRRVVLVVSLLNGETSAVEAARLDRGSDRGLTGEVLPGGENALRTRPKDEEAIKDEQLKQKVGDLPLDNDILREALKPLPFERETSDA